MNAKWALLLPSIALFTALTLWWTQQTPNQKVISLALADNCQLHQSSCQTQYQDSLIRIDISPKPILIAKPLAVSVQLDNLQTTQVQLDINGSNMYMGYNRIPLKQQADGSWTGKSLLAFCTIDIMQWQLTLLIDLPDGTQLQVPFPLTTPFSQQ